LEEELFQMCKLTPLIILAVLISSVTVCSQESPDMVWKKHTGISWSNVTKQSGLFLAVQTGVRVMREDETRRELKGPYFRDYIDSVVGLHGWNDGDPIAVNYLGHPWMGGVAGRILINNDPKANTFEFRNERSYWYSRLKALGWSATYSAIFELSPVGEAAIGNIGGDPWPNGMAYCDLVNTPVLGTAVIVGEDLADRYFLKWAEQRSGNKTLNAALRTVINPSRSFSNLMRYKLPWYRDNRKSLVSAREPAATNLAAK
jgi:hypothetical protein